MTDIVIDDDNVNTPPSNTNSDPILAEHAAEIRRVGKRAKQRAIKDIAEIGRHLAEAKDYVGHGNRGAYLAWIETEFGWSDQNARRFIHVYRLSRDPEFNNLLNSDLPISALYELAAPNTPLEARKEIAERIETSENLSVADVQEVTKRAKGKKDVNTPKSGTAKAGKAGNGSTKAADPPEVRKAHYAAQEENEADEAANGAVELKTETSPVVPTNSADALRELFWGETIEQRRAVLEREPIEEIIKLLSDAQKIALCDRLVGLTIATASKRTDFAHNCTTRLHVILRCAEQPEPSAEDIRNMIAAGRAIVRDAEKREIARSAIVIAEGTKKIRKKRK